MVKRITLGFVALAALSAVAFGAVQGFSVKRTPKEGQTLKYKMEGAVTIQGMSITIKGIFEEKVTKVESNGNYSVEQKQIESKAVVDGNEMEMPTGSASTTNYKANGEIISVTGGQSEDANAYRMAMLGLMVDAGKLVSTGDKWSFDIKPDAKTGVVAAKADYSVLGDEKVGSIDTFKVKAVVKETEGSAAASSESTVWLDKKDSSMVKLETKWVNAPFPNMPPLDATIKMSRIE